MDRALASGARGRGFESLIARHYLVLITTKSNEDEKGGEVIMKKCLISLLPILLLGLSTANSETLEGWQYKEQVDEFTDKVWAVNATVYSSDVLGIDQYITVQCSKPKNSLGIGIKPSNIYLNFKKFEKVKIRIDKNPTRVDNGFVGDSIVGVWNNSQGDDEGRINDSSSRGFVYYKGFAKRIAQANTKSVNFLQYKLKKAGEARILD